MTWEVGREPGARIVATAMTTKQGDRAMTIDSYDALRNANSPEQFCAVLEALAMELIKIGTEYMQDDDGVNATAYFTIAADLDVIASNYGNGRVTKGATSLTIEAARLTAVAP